MTRLVITTPDIALAEIHLAPGCNRFGREGPNDVLVPHTSVSRQHCEVWLTEDAVLVRDLNSRNGTFIDEQRVQEAQVFDGQTLQLGDVKMVLTGAPVRISVPDLPLPQQARPQLFMPDGAPCCLNHDNLAASLECTKCRKAFCTTCVRELRVAGSVPRRFCPECGGPCERIAPTVKESKRPGWLNRIVEAFTKPTVRR